MQLFAKVTNPLLQPFVAAVPLSCAYQIQNDLVEFLYLNILYVYSAQL